MRSIRIAHTAVFFGLLLSSSSALFAASPAAPATAKVSGAATPGPAASSDSGTSSGSQTQTQSQSQNQPPAQPASGLAPIAPPPGAPAIVRTLPDTPPAINNSPNSNNTRTRTRTHTRASWLDSFYFDGGITFGNSRPTIPSATDEPFMLQMGLNATIAYKVYAFLVDNTRVTLSLGLAPDYRFSGQYSTVDPLAGNFRGTRFQLFTPTIVGRIEEDWTVKLGVELTGSYNLSRPTYNGNSLDFGSPFGVSLTGLYSLAKILKVPQLYGGLQLEYTKFGTVEDSSLGSQSLSSSINFLEFGIAVSYAF